MARSRLSILSNASKADIILEPYPHLIIKNALDQEVYDELASTYPQIQTLLDEREIKDTWYDYPAVKVAQSPDITDLWKEFFAYHVSGEFWADVVEVFDEQFRLLHPDLEEKLGKSLSELDSDIRQEGAEDNQDNYQSDLSMECQFYVNYTRKLRAVRGPHVDRTTELYAALLYFRTPEDDSTGSDLDVCRAIDPKKVYPGDRKIRIDTLPAEVCEHKVEISHTAKYEANTLVFFLNSNKSIHGVSPRSATETPRQHINFCADIFKAPEGGLFEMTMAPHKRLKTQLQKTPVAWRLAEYIPD